jgi:ornithine decarboxylase
MAPSVLSPTEDYHLSHEALESTDHALSVQIDHGVAKAKELIGAALKGRVEAIDQDTCSVGDEDAFFVADLGEVYRQHIRWKKHLGRVKPHYGTSKLHTN